MYTQPKIVFQPIFHTGTMQIFAYEGLMRFPDISISEVISKCETYSDFYEIEKLTFEKTLQEYENRNYKEKLFINSFPHVNLNQTDLSTLLDKHEDTFKRVVIEMLEYPGLDLQSVKQKKRDVKKYNVLFAIDDFGINTLENLEAITPCYLKIDRSIISGIADNEKQQNNLQDILKIADKHSCFTIAEGIENDKELDYLKEKVDYFQGFLLGKPN